jgi:hypothetical protein
MDAKAADLIAQFSAPAGSIGSIPFGILHGSKGKFSVLSRKLGEFLDAYCLFSEKDEAAEEICEKVNELGLPIGEVITLKTTPIMITMLFRFHLSGDSKEEPSLYGEDFTLTIAHIIQGLIVDKLEISARLAELICCVLESKPWHKGEDTFVRIRFQFPYAQVDSGYQQRVFKKELIKLLRKEKVISKLETQPIGDWDVILEDMKPIVAMYRSKDDLDQCPMTFTHLYGHINEDQVEAGQAPDMNLKDVFKPRDHSHVYCGTTSDAFLAKEVDLKYWLPLFLSINFWCGVVNPKETEQDTKSEHGSGVLEFDEKINDRDPKQMIRRLLPLLKPFRYDMEPYWLDIGRVLYNITKGGTDGLEIWIQASSKATVEGRGKEECTARYFTLRDSFLTIKTVAWYAREDSPVGYADWHNAWCQHSLMEAMTMTHNDVAEAVYRVFWLDYVCSNSGKQGWYRFHGAQLRPIDDAVYLRIDITDKLIPIYKNLKIRSIQESMKAECRAAEKKNLNTQDEEIGKLIKKLGNQGYMTSLIRACFPKFYVEDIVKKRNANANTTGWANCVIECCSNYAYPRPGKPEDYITMSTDTSYPIGPEWDNGAGWKHPLVIELMKWLGQLFIDSELLAFVLKDMASMLYGSNAEKLFRVWTGDTNTGKSTFIKFMQAIFGIYCCDFPVEMVCGKTMKAETGLNPALAQAAGTHIAVVSEPGKEDRLQNGKVKRWTGRDRFFARFCCENGGSINASFKLIFMCNGIPDMPDSDEAGMLRFLILPFLSQWVDKPPEDEKEQYAKRQFKKDPFFDRRIPDLARAGAWVMVQYYPKYKTEGLVPPKIVRDYTEKHWEDNDLYLDFIKEHITHVFRDADRKEINVDVSMCSSEMYPAFKTWYKTQYPDYKIPDHKRFHNEMIAKHRLGSQKAKRWFGIQVKASGLAVPKLDH